MIIEISCEICSKRVRKIWTDSMQGTPRYCSIACKAEAQRRTKPVTKEWLEQKYLVEKLSANEIARLVHRDAKRVWEWLRDYGIPTRPRGVASSPGVFVKGQPSAFKGKTHSSESRERIRQHRLQDGHVPYLKNGVHHLKGKRGTDTPNWKGGVTAERQLFYSSEEWKQAVKAVWARENARYKRCDLHHNDVRGRQRFHIHHIESFTNKERRADIENLVLLCDECHRWIHSRQNTERGFLA